MIRRLVLPALLLLVAGGLAMLPGTSAIMSDMDRPQAAHVVSDSGGALGMTSFNNVAFTMSTTYFYGAGSLRNNYNGPMTITLTATPSVSQFCLSVTGGTCNPAASWNLWLCLSTDQSSQNTRTCRGSQSSQLPFSGTTTGTVTGQSFSPVNASAGQTLYMFVKGSAYKQGSTGRLCATAVFSADGTNSGQTVVQLTNDAYVSRSQIYRNGSGCP